MPRKQRCSRLYLALATLALLVEAVLFGCATVGTEKNQTDFNVKYGFRDIAWGSTPADVSGMHFLGRSESGKGAAWTVRKNEQLSFGQVSVQSIRYLYVDMALSGITAKFMGIDAFNGLTRELESTLGRPTIDRGYEKIWNQDGVMTRIGYGQTIQMGQLSYTKIEKSN